MAMLDWGGLAAVCVFFALTNVPAASSQGLGKFFQGLGRLLTNGRFFHLVMMGFLAVGTQFALMFLSVTFLVEAKGLAIFQASVVLSSFFVGLFLGRLICGWMALRVPNTRIILFLLFFQVLSLGIAWRGDGWVSAGALMASGLACSGIFPCLLALTGTLFYEAAGTSLGVLAFMNSLGSVTVIWVSGLLSQRVNIEFGFLAMVLFSMAGFLLFLSKYGSLLDAERNRIPPSS